MKKFLISTIVAALVATMMGVFVACGDKSSNSSGVSDAEAAKEAMKYVRSVYDKKEVVETPKSYEVIGVAPYKTKMYTVKWQVTSDFENFGNYVSVGTMNEDKQVPITVQKAKDQEILYTLKATITVGKSTENAEFPRKVPAGKAEEGQTEATLDFSDAKNRESQTGDLQVWKQDGITLTNAKGSGSEIKDYSNPARFYKNSVVTIEFSGMTTVIFHTTGYDYPADLKTALDATGAGTATVTDNDVTLVLSSPMDKLEFTLTEGKVFLSSIDVIANENGATDEEKVAGAKATLDIAEKNYMAVGTYNLPAEKNDVAVKWALKAGTTSNYVSINNEGKLVISDMPEEETEVELTATLTLNDATDTKDFTIKLVPLGLENNGTEEKPYKPSEAKTVTKQLAEGTTGSTEVYVRGYVIGWTFDSGYKSFNVYIADQYTAGKDTEGEDVFYIYAAKPDADHSFLKEDGTGINNGDLATFKGKLQYYKDKNTGNLTPEMTMGGALVAWTAGTRTDADIIADAKKSFDLAVKKYTEVNAEGVALPTEYQGATLNWALKQGTTSEYVAVEGNKLKINSLPNEETKVKLEVTFTKGTATAQTKEIEITIVAVAALEPGNYTLSMDQKTNNKTLYFNGKQSGNFGGTTENEEEAATVIIEKSGSDYTMKVETEDGTKYIVLKQSGNYYNFNLSDTAGNWQFNSEYEVLTWKVDSNEYYLGTYGTYNTISASTIDKITTSYPIKYNKVEELPPDTGDDDRITTAMGAVAGLVKASYNAGEYNLPSTHTATGATLKWEVVDGKDVVEIDENNKMTVTNPASANVTGVTIKVTVSYGEGTPQSKNDITFTVNYEAPVNYGTLQAPLTVTEALAIAAKQCTADNSFTKQKIYMTGKVTNVPTDKGTYYQNINLEDLTGETKQTILVYSINLRTSDEEGFVAPAAPAKNDVLVIYGYIKNNVYNGVKTIEFASNGSDVANRVYIEKNDRGTSAITVSITQENDADTATVTGIPATATNGTTVTFTVAPATGKKVTAVKVAGTKINPTTEGGNSYSFTVVGDMTVAVETADEGSVDSDILYTLVTSDHSGTNNNYASSCDVTVDDVIWNVEGNAQNKPWRLGGGKSAALTNQDRKITGKTAISGKVTEFEIEFGGISITVNSVTLNVYKTNPTVAGAVAAYTKTVEYEADKKTTVKPADDEDWTDCYYQLVVNVTTASGSNKYIEVKSMTFTGVASTPATTSETATQLLSLPEALPIED